MKKTLLLLTSFFCLASYAQNVIPPFINYQAVIRDASGIPIAPGATFTLNFKIFTNAATLTAVYEEEHLVTVPLDQVINLRIGSGTGIAPLNNFSAIPWNLGQAHYLVSKDGNSIGSKTAFASVPYAFSSGGGASTSYSPSSNISITGNVLDLTNKLSTAVSVGSNQFPNSKIPTFSADQKGRLTNTGEYPANMSGDIIGKLDSQLVAKLRGTPLSTLIPVNGQVLQFNGIEWRPAAGGNSSVTINQSGIVNVSPSGIPSTTFIISASAPIFATSGIGTIVLGAYPNYNLNIPTPSISFNATSGVLTFQQFPFLTSLNISPQLGLTGNVITAGTSTLAIPALSYWSKPTLTATELGNIGDNVGIGASNPTEKLVVQTTAGADISVVSTPGNMAFLNLGTTANHFLGRVGYNSTNHSMSLWTNNTPDRMFISSIGNVGIATNVPAAKLDINGDFKLGTGGSVLQKVIGGSVQPIYGTINPSTNLATSFAAAGATVGDRVVVTLSGGTSVTVVLVSASISAANAVNINLYNFGGTAAPGGMYTINYVIYK
ncbi:MAG: hypothetical protein SGJ15_02130 [Bacteroidota bacterium]|nr:hypothetical protein [Bacteroidota bacterium]